MNDQELRSELCRQRALGQISQADYEQRLTALDELQRLNLRDSQAPNSLYDSSVGALPTAARPAPLSPGFTAEPLSDLRMVTQPRARAWTPQPLQPGDMVGNFRLEDVKKGGEGQVWRAFDTLGNRTVALKMLPPELLAQPDEVERLQEAFRRVQDFHHPHVCPVYVLQQDTRAGMYQVMRFIQGQTLSAYRRAVVKEHGSFSLEEVVRVLEPVAQALDAAHARKIVHRDVTPRNIMVDEQSHVWLIDFGLSAEIRSSILRVSQVRMDSSGTAPYMAPEQFRGQLQDGFTDQYALGVVAYELLSGRVPFEADDMVVLRECVLNELIEPLADQQDFVNEALHCALAKTRTDRFKNCAEFIGVLRQPSLSIQPISAASSKSIVTVTSHSLIASVLDECSTSPGECKYALESIVRQLAVSAPDSSDFRLVRDRFHQVADGQTSEENQNYYLSKLCEIQAIAGQQTAAEKLASTLPATLHGATAAYASIAISYLDLGNQEEYRRLMECCGAATKAKFRGEWGERDSALLAFAHASSAGGDFATARSVLPSIHSSSEKEKALTLIAIFEALTSSYTDAVTRMRDGLLSIGATDVSKGTRVVAMALLAHERPFDACRLCTDLDGLDHVCVLTSVVERLVKLGEEQRAMKVLNEAMSALQNVPPTSQSSCRRGLAVASDAVGDHKSATQLLEMLQSQDYARAVAGIAIARSKRGNKDELEEALHWLAIAKGRIRVSKNTTVVCELSRAYFHCGQTAEALELASLQDSRFDRLMVLTAIIQASIGSPWAATQILERYYM